MYESILSPLEELAKFLGLSISTLLIILGVVSAVALGSFTSLTLGTRWGMVFGVVPLSVGVFLGLLPVWIVFACALPVALMLYRSLFGDGFREGGFEEDAEEEEEEIKTEVMGTPEIPRMVAPKAKSSRKPPWSK